MTKEQALQILHENMQSPNLRKHCYGVGAVMKALANRLNKESTPADAEVVTGKWEVAGLLHDADYEKTKEDTSQHTKMVLGWLENYSVSQDVKDAILAHGWGFVEGNPEPKNKMEWALYCCDELTGFIIAVTLIRPTKKLSDVDVENILGKWKEKSFAAGVHREQIELAQEKLGIPLPEFIAITLMAMQEISTDLGL